MADRPDFGSGKGGEGGVTIIKRIKKGGEASHGGAWKVAYADFVTAMMAFFLLLWLLNAVTEEQLNGVADYFTPIAASTRDSGAGGMLGGQTVGEGSSQSHTGSTAAVVLPPPSIGSGGQEMTDPKEGQTQNDAVEAAVEAKQAKEFQQAATDIKRAVTGIPELAPLSTNLLTDTTSEGLRVQLIDSDKVDMFQPASAVLYPKAKEILAQIAKVILKMPNKVSISGHTDISTTVDPSGYTNWELSADRALAVRRALLEGGLSDNQIDKVVGRADKEPLDAQQPRSPRNRRVSIVVLRGENVPKDTFNRVPDFLGRRGPQPTNAATGETPVQN